LCGTTTERIVVSALAATDDMAAAARAIWEDETCRKALRLRSERQALRVVAEAAVSAAGKTNKEEKAT
jgi:hypothetical protein